WSKWKVKPKSSLPSKRDRTAIIPAAPRGRCSLVPNCLVRLPRKANSAPECGFFCHTCCADSGRHMRRMSLEPQVRYAYWMIPAIAHGEVTGPNPEPLRSLARRVQDEAALEMRCAPPALIIFERRRNYIYQPSAFDVRGFFMR